jgi:hypothetical protein
VRATRLTTALDKLTADPASVRQSPAPRSFSDAAARHIERARSLFDDPNIVGAGIAEKISQGQVPGVLSIAFYVRRKLPKSDIPAESLIPEVIAGGRDRAIFTDVVEVGDIVPQANIGAPPLRSGFSIGHVDAGAGTLGAFVRKNGKLFILSNAHVLARSGLASAGDDIQYPGPPDCESGTGDIVAALDSFTPLVPDAGFVNLADAALAEIVAPFASTAIPDLLGAITPLRIATPVRGMTVVKRGRSTWDSESVVRDVDFRLVVEFPEIGKVGFARQVRCDHYTEAGDSGAVVVDKASGAIVGLHFAGSALSSVFTPIRLVMDALRFRF